MPSPYSSPGSITDAEQLAVNLGIRFELLPIDQILAACQASLAPF